MSSAVQTLILRSFSPSHQPVDIRSHGAVEMSDQAFELCASEEKRARHLPGAQSRLTHTEDQLMVKSQRSVMEKSGLGDRVP